MPVTRESAERQAAGATDNRPSDILASIRYTGRGGANAKKCEDRMSANPGRPTLISDLDVHLFNEGTHYRLYDKLGARPLTLDGVAGTYFAVWAPNAERVTVMGEFNFWDRSTCPLVALGGSGIWH